MYSVRFHQVKLYGSRVWDGVNDASALPQAVAGIGIPTETVIAVTVVE
ncbi:MAG: hypothetical protein K1Y36_26465 [Blastocatellia bacterium]|nr:hypothetical protein [Blastocatellia bacterium]